MNEYSLNGTLLRSEDVMSDSTSNFVFDTDVDILRTCHNKNSLNEMVYLIAYQTHYSYSSSSSSIFLKYVALNDSLYADNATIDPLDDHDVIRSIVNFNDMLATQATQIVTPQQAGQPTDNSCIHLTGNDAYNWTNTGASLSLTLLDIECLDNLDASKDNYDDHNTFYFSILFLNNIDSNIYMCIINSVGHVVVSPWKVTGATDIGSYTDYTSSYDNEIMYKDFYDQYSNRFRAYASLSSYVEDENDHSDLLVSWIQDCTFYGDSSKSCILGKVYDSEGSCIKGDFVINRESWLHHEMIYDVISLDNNGIGGYAVLWYNDATTLIYISFINATGNYIESSIDLNGNSWSAYDCDSETEKDMKDTVFDTCRVYNDFQYDINSAVMVEIDSHKVDETYPGWFLLGIITDYMAISVYRVRSDLQEMILLQTTELDWLYGDSTVEDAAVMYIDNTTVFMMVTMFDDYNSRKYGEIFVWNERHLLNASFCTSAWFCNCCAFCVMFFVMIQFAG